METPSRSAPDNQQEYHRRICRAVDFINAHLSDNPTVAEVAGAAPFSSFHFQRLFRAMMGESVGQCMRRLRLEAGATRLRFRPQEDVTDIALDLGFSTPQNFAKAFKKHFAVSPTQYRLQPAKEEDKNRKLSASESPNESMSLTDNVTVQKTLARRVVYHRHFGSYQDMGVQQAFDELVRWAKQRDLDVFENYLGIPWD
ncbi:MAG: helix-turn-helix domain-containing protein, partial [Rubripirellula sp.]